MKKCIMTNGTSRVRISLYSVILMCAGMSMISAGAAMRAVDPLILQADTGQEGRVLRMAAGRMVRSDMLQARTAADIDKKMKKSRFIFILIGFILAGAFLLTGPNYAETTCQQRLFSSPDEAVKALLEAVSSGGSSEALCRIYGDQFKDILTGDRDQDLRNARRLASALAGGYTFVQAGENKVTIEVGPRNWPMPIPLVKENGVWRFDTAAGKDEIISRHIGRNELCAIGVCRAYVLAQKKYEEMYGNYARKFMSSSGKKDGLYWPNKDNEPQSPFGPLVAKACNQGFFNYQNAARRPFHGYYFKILTGQGKDVSGGAVNYLVDGKLAGGFGLVAYPARWDRSGVMTFIVNQDGKVYQRNLGEKTLQIASAMRVYDPDSAWQLVQDEGLPFVVSEK
jgi:hypothetical protein